MACNEYPGGLDERSALKLLVATVEKLKFSMKRERCNEYAHSGLITTWDESIPAIHYLERNLKWAKEVLENEPTKSANG